MKMLHLNTVYMVIDGTRNWLSVSTLFIGIKVKGRQCRDYKSKNFSYFDFSCSSSHKLTVSLSITGDFGMNKPRKSKIITSS